MSFPTIPQPTGGNYYYQQPYYGYPQGPGLGDQLSRTVDNFTRSISNGANDITRSITDGQNDMQRSFRRMQRTWNGEPEYSVARLASWGGGAALLWSICDSSMRNSPQGLLAIGVLGVGAVAGNWLYDWFMDNYGQNFGY